MISRSEKVWSVLGLMAFGFFLLSLCVGLPTFATSTDDPVGEVEARAEWPSLFTQVAQAEDASHE